MKFMGCTTESKSIDYESYWHAELDQKYQLRKLMGCTAKIQKSTEYWIYWDALLNFDRVLKLKLMVWSITELLMCWLLNIMGRFTYQMHLIKTVMNMEPNRNAQLHSSDDVAALDFEL
jgi:hypothetical protein